MEIRKIKSKEEWEKFLSTQRCVFLQSSLWGDFKEKYQKVNRIEARKDDKIVGVCQFFEEKTIFGNYLYIPFGPVSSFLEVREKLLNKVLEVGKEGKSIFVRVEPLYEINRGKNQFSRTQPRKTLVSKIDKPIEEIIKDFHSSTRYNVRYAERKGVVIKEGDSIDCFYNLLKKTKERQGFSSYTKEYFQNLLKVEGAKLVYALYNDKVVCAIILLHFNKTVTFLHSASDYSMKHLRAPALLRFESIKQAKERGFIFYDFWGIDEKRFPGVTSYKKGFGGEELSYPNGKDFPIRNILYFFYKVAVYVKKRIK
jgi:lipid II:glycine glycyltransferase (peptidoglycan interpeptide bridge formation enzyme)